MGGVSAQLAAGERWAMDTCWRAAVAVTGAVYDVPGDLILADSRGRGPRPPQRVWEAKKMAVHLAVILSGCRYAQLARTIGYHRDTVTSHCEDMRGAVMADPVVERLAEALEAAARFRLKGAAAVHLAGARAHLVALETAAEGLSDGAGYSFAEGFIRQNSTPSSDKTGVHESVIENSCNRQAGGGKRGGRS